MVMVRILALAALAITAASAAHAQDATFATASYIELTPPAASQGAALLRTYRDTSRNDTGNLKIEVVQRLNRPSQFVLLSLWQDKAAFEAHAATAHAKSL